MAVSRDLVGHTVGDSPGRAEERLSGGLILAFAEQNVHQVPIPINSPIEVDPTTLHFQIGFVTVPAAPYFPAPLLTEGLAQHWCQFGFSLAHGFMSECHTSFKKHLGQITQAEFVTHTPQHHQTDYIGRVMHAVEDRGLCCKVY